jgi:oxalate---CoA ligase
VNLRSDSGASALLSEMEATVAAIWAEVLGGDVGLDDDFFARGGDSLLAVWLIEEIAAKTGTELPLSVLLERATIRQMAAAIDGASAGMSRGINVDGARRPLFWIHGWAELLALREHFDADQPVFQIQEPLARHWDVKPRLELSARRYVDELRRIQPGGPYQLIGYSFGGVIAYEMSQQLRRAGEPVSFLGLLDTPALGYEFPLALRLRMQAANVAQFRRMLAEMRTKSWLGRAAYARHAVPAITRHRWLRWVLRRLPHDWSVPTPPGSMARVRYEPTSYSGPIVLFWATEGRERTGSSDLGWAALAAGGLSVRPVPGNHRTMAYGANARVLAEQVAQCLAQAGDP